MVLSAECKQQCICHRKGRVVCKPYQCSTRMTCVLSNHKWDCIRQEGHCTITHGDVFTTFDGVSGKVPSIGSYEISSLVNTTSASWFRVVAELQKCPMCPTPAVHTLTVFLPNVIVRFNRKGFVWVRRRQKFHLMKIHDLSISFAFISFLWHFVLPIKMSNTKQPFEQSKRNPTNSPQARNRI